VLLLGVVAKKFTYFAQFEAEFTVQKCFMLPDDKLCRCVAADIGQLVLFYPHLKSSDGWVEVWKVGNVKPLPRAFRVLNSVAEALGALHSQKVYHNDLKGDNVFYNYFDGRAKLIDFGQAAPFDRNIRICKVCPNSFV